MLVNWFRRRGDRPRVMYLGLRAIGDVQGGVEKHVTELVRYLPYGRDQIEVIGRAPYRSTAIADATLPRVRWLPTLRHPVLEAFVHSLIGTAYACLRRPSVLHIHGIGPNLVTPLARLGGLKVVSTHHGNDYDREKWGGFARFMLRLGEQCAVMGAQVCISISPVGAEKLRRSYHRDVRFIPNGVTTAERPPPGRFLAERQLNAGSYIVNVARLVPEKRQMDLIEAFERAAIDNVKLVLIGGADHDTPYARSVLARSAANPMIVATGHIGGDQLAELFGNAGLFALPSTHEGLPIALLEAMAFGHRVLVSDLPVYRAMGVPEQCITRVGDIDDLASRLRDAFSQNWTAHPVDWGAMLASYRWDQIARDTALIYDQLIGD